MMTAIYAPVGFRWADATWNERHTRIPWKHTTRIVDRWVYILAKTDKDDRPWLYAELYFDDKGRMRALDLDAARTKPGNRFAPLKASPERRLMARSTHPILHLPLMSTLVGDPVTYWAWGSPFPLDQTGFENVAALALDGSLPAFAPQTARMTLCFEGVNTRKEHTASLAHLPVFDPPHLAEKLRQKVRKYVDARDGMFKDVANTNRFLIARMLKGMLESSAFQRLKLDDDWRPAQNGKPSGREEMEQWLKEFEDKLHAYTRGAEQVAIELGDLLQSDIWQTFEVTAKSTDEPVYLSYIESMARFAGDLAVTEEGKKFLREALERPSVLIDQLIAPTKAAPSPDEELKELLGTPKAAQSYASKLGEYLNKYWLATYQSLRFNIEELEKAERLTNGFNYLFAQHGEPQLKVVRTPESPIHFQLLYKGPPAASSSWLNTSARTANSLSQSVDIVTNLLGLRSWFSEKNQDFQTTLAGLNSLSGLCGTSMRLSGLAGAGKAFGIVGSVMGVATGTMDVYEAKEGDVAIGHGISTVGAALGLAAALGLGPGWLALVAALLGTAGSALAEVFRDSELELFVRHCFWGRRYGLPPDPPLAPKDWMRGRLANWRDDKRGVLQIQALLHQLCAFTVSAAKPPVDWERERGFPIRVDCGLTPPGARLRVEWSSAQDQSSQHWDYCRMYVVPDGKGFRVLGPDGKTAIATTDVRHFQGARAATGSFFEISVPTKHKQHLWSIAQVQLELSGMGAMKGIPDAPVRFKRLRGGYDLHDASRSSLRAPEDEGIYTVRAYDPRNPTGDHSHADRKIGPGTPIEIMIATPPREATLVVSWSVGLRWTYARSELKRVGSTWQLQGNRQSLRFLEVTSTRVRISFPRNVDWDAQEPVKSKVELLSNGKAYPALEYWVRDRQGRPEPEKSSSVEA